MLQIKVKKKNFHLGLTLEVGGRASLFQIIRILNYMKSISLHPRKVMLHYYKNNKCPLAEGIYHGAWHRSNHPCTFGVINVINFLKEEVDGDLRQRSSGENLMINS